MAIEISQGDTLEVGYRILGVNTTDDTFSGLVKLPTGTAAFTWTVEEHNAASSASVYASGTLSIPSSETRGWPAPGRYPFTLRWVQASGEERKLANNYVTVKPEVR